MADESGGQESGNKNPAVVVEEPNASHGASGLQHYDTFCAKIGKGALASGSFIESAYSKWSIVTDPTDVDGPVDVSKDSDVVLMAPSHGEKRKSGLEIEEDKGLDTIDNIHESGRVVEAELIQFPTVQTTPNATQPKPAGPLKGYEYTEFIPIPTRHTLLGHIHMVPTQPEALQAVKDLHKILHKSATRDEDIKTQILIYGAVHN